MNKINYQKILDEKIRELEGEDTTKSLLLHACCAPCSSYTLSYLSNYFEITIYFYNPNIDTEEEYLTRNEELSRLIKEMPMKNKVELLTPQYDRERYIEIARGREDVKEGGIRCFYCYDLRMEEAARVASVLKKDFFTTTLSISPHKNAEWLNRLGEKYSKKYGVEYLYSDFKKKGGYQRSIELSKEYGLYRQDYCGCEYSKKEAIDRAKRGAN